MNQEDFENLLYRREGDALDFKAAQYAFDDDEERGELLKDLLAFANAWRDGDAHILIGVQEQKGNDAKAIVCGVTHHLDENNLQTFVNSKTSAPLRFVYEPIVIDGKPCAVIKIPLQPRPLFLKKAFGKLSPAQVYVRRGSSTQIALPDEISRMGDNPGGKAGSRFVLEIVPEWQAKHTPTAEMLLAFILHNEGDLTAYDVFVEFQGGENDPVFAEGWFDAGSRLGERRCRTQMIHPDEKTRMATLKLKKLEVAVRYGVVRSSTVNAYYGPELNLRLRFLSKDQPAKYAHLRLDQEQILEIANQSLRNSEKVIALRCSVSSKSSP